ncbi:uncharacterized protein LOC108733201 isoform X1 [Agrilus planipennis]|uniref:Uncharacterized protein LOC108733201 isoform X1 n=1 Tax=Agrilus planipennis TaxID=224129 RepID=A0A1W4WI55_AGRPL|nr:uncharacterized protein LOC108733201 isoform X1 [Agrilus planipennis]
MEEESSNNYDNDFNDGVKQRYKQYERKRRQEKLLKVRFRKLHKQFAKKLKEREDYNVHVLEHTESVLQSDIENALKILEDVHVTKFEKEKPSPCSQSISKNITPHLTQEPNVLWYLPTYIPQLIRNSILRQEWDNVTRLLLMLLEHKPVYMPHIKMTAFINFLKNPADSDGQVLDEFLQLCFVSMKNAKSIPSFDVCYKEIAE